MTHKLILIGCLVVFIVVGAGLANRNAKVGEAQSNKVIANTAIIPDILPQTTEDKAKEEIKKEEKAVEEGKVEVKF